MELGDAPQASAGRVLYRPVKMHQKRLNGHGLGKGVGSRQMIRFPSGKTEIMKEGVGGKGRGSGPVSWHGIKSCSKIVTLICRDLPP
jgi:hypothetical protein